MDQQTYQINPNVTGQAGQAQPTPLGAQTTPVAPSAVNPTGAGVSSQAQTNLQMQAGMQPSAQAQPAASNWPPQADVAGVNMNAQAVGQPAVQGVGQPAVQAVGQPVGQGVGQIAQPQVIMPQNPVDNSNAASLGALAVKANQASPVSPNKEIPTSTQASLLISELRDNVVIMKDGSFRAVVACKSINFDLMSEVEREGVEYSYQNFLNSLKFSIQILVRSQRVDIGPYIERLSEIRRNNDNMLLGVLMDDYINFIDILSQEANIMDKAFFVVIPYYTSEDAEKLVEQTRSIFKAFSKQKNTGVTRINRETYNKALAELTNRVDAVMSGLFQIGVHSVRLNTKELAELYYNYNNPDTAVREPLVDFSKLATMYVRKGENNG